MFWSSVVGHYVVWEMITSVSVHTASTFRVADRCSMFLGNTNNHLPDVTQKITE
jgi:hypothetical protein